MKQRKDLDRFYWDKRKPIYRKGKTHYSKPYLTVGNYFKVSVPEYSSLFEVDDHDDFCNFIRNVSSLCRLQKNIIIDFDECKSIKACCMVILYSVLDDYISGCEDVSLRFNSNRAAKAVRENIENSGIKNLCNKSGRKIDFKNIEKLPIQSNRTADADDIVDYIQYSVFNDSLNAEKERILSSAIEEAVLNVQHHAYNDGEEQRWWVITDIVGGNQLFLAIYDLGVGIPNRAPKTAWIKDIAEKFSWYKAILLRSKDDELIELSMELSKSRTGHSERGLGSLSIRELVEINPVGSLHVFSSKGGYTSTSLDDSERTAYRSSIPGTLVQWNIEIDGNYDGK